MLNKLKLFLYLNKKDYEFIKSLNFSKPVKVISENTKKTSYTPKDFPSEYCWIDNFTQKIKLLLEDGKTIVLTRKFGDDYPVTLLEVEET